jgi:membrane protein YqaA with SNARE-associated domain
MKPWMKHAGYWLAIIAVLVLFGKPILTMIAGFFTMVAGKLP